MDSRNSKNINSRAHSTFLSNNTVTLDLFKLTPISAVIIDPKSKILNYNKAFAVLHAAENNSAIQTGRDYADFLSPDQPDHYIGTLLILNNERKTQGPFNLTLLDRDRNAFPAEVWFSHCPGNADEPLAIIVFGKDLSPGNRTFRALKEICQYADTLIRTSSVMIIGLDESGQIIEFNPAAEELTGYKKSELENDNWFDILIPRKRHPDVYNKFKRLHSGEPPKI